MRGQMQIKKVAGSSDTLSGRTAIVKALPRRDLADASLMKRVSHSKDKAALEEIAAHYAPRMKSWLMFRGEQSSTAEDIVQDVVILVWTRGHQFDPTKGAFSAWLFRIVRNTWIDHKRKYDRLQPTDPDIVSTMADEHIDGADAELVQLEASQAVQEELSQLPIDQKQMLQLAFFEGLSHSQIA